MSKGLIIFSFGIIMTLTSCLVVRNPKRVPPRRVVYNNEQPRHYWWRSYHNHRTHNRNRVYNYQTIP